VLVLGPSGSGKSTLTLCLDGLIPHLVEGDYAGRVAVAGLVVGDTPVHVLSQQTGLVFQDPESQFCTLTVEDEVAFGLENLGRPPDEIEGAIDRALASVELSGHRERHLATLSGGEKQRVALAAVLAMGPGVLVLDEPSANLDPHATSELFDLVRTLAADRGHTVIIIEHKLDELIAWIDSVLALDADGRLLFRGSPEEAFYDHASLLSAAGVWLPQTAELVSALRQRGWAVPGRPLGVADTIAALAATSGLVDRLTERSSLLATQTDAEAAPASAPPAEPLYLVRDLSFSYPGSGGFRALRGLSLAIEKGAFLAIAGTNGAGKTTLAAVLSGVVDSPPGAVFLEGEDLSAMSGVAISGRVGHVFQNPEHQFVTATVYGELAFSLSAKAGRKGARYLSPGQRQLVESWLDRLGLLSLAAASPFSLSQGQKRRLSVAAMLIRGQSALILDEPTLGQDEVQAARLMAMAEQFREAGGTVVMITHDMRLVAEHATHLLVLAEGQAAFAGSPADFFSHPPLVEAAGLEMPVAGRVSVGLLQRSDPCGLLTIDAVLTAAGEAR
jgi:energy-coupling factor transporter ATP-binding protein EcfA2